MGELAEAIQTNESEEAKKLIRQRANQNQVIVICLNAYLVIGLFNSLGACDPITPEPWEDAWWVNSILSGIWLVGIIASLVQKERSRTYVYNWIFGPPFAFGVGFLLGYIANLC